jgi:hypothetical protein
VQILDVKNPQHVSSATVVEADLGVANRRLLIMSGLAMVNWVIDTDELTGAETRVNLGVFARDLESASPFVGLAHIANDETGFAMAVDQAKVQLDPATGELFLYFKMALMGEWSSLERVGYQVVATVVRADASISGTISWPTSLYRPPSADPASVAPHLVITANHRTMSQPDGPFAPEERLEPVANGAVTNVIIADDTCRATYRIAAPPMAMPLKVTLAVNRSFAPNAHGTLRPKLSAGPEVFTLTPQRPAETVDFIIEKVAIG